jgi:hypothetical protein
MSSATLAKMPPAPSGEGINTASNAFVINLVSSTTPVALTRPDHAGLKRFTFFVSRRREEGRERFRLHMGYFNTQEEAEQLLDIVRGIYPGAWAGLAPGRRLGAAASPAAVTAAADAAQSAAQAAPNIAATSVTAEKPANVGKPMAVAVAAAALMPPAPKAESPPEKAEKHLTVTLALVPDEGRRPLADLGEVTPVAAATATPTVAVTAEAAGAAEQRAARNSLSNIRAAIASLEDSGIRSPVLDTLPELQPAIIPVAQPVRAASLSDTATLRLLETGDTRRLPRQPTRGAIAAVPPAASGPSPLTALNQSAAPPAAPREDKPCYAVQLMWAVQPIDMAQVPQLAIFSAYSLYAAEGNRDGRRWYGLRLGFFTDAVSAKQVAQYVRADFATVSVVPVTVRERENAVKAVGGTTKAAGGEATSVRALAAAAKPKAATNAAGKPPEFAFIEGTVPLTPKGAAPAPSAKPAGPRMIAGRVTRGAPGKRVTVRKPGQVNAAASLKPKTLEETLEILGANQLQVDNERGPSINDSGAGHLRLETAKGRPSKLSRLIGRLSERMGS